MAADKEPLQANCYLLSLNKSQQNYLQFSYNKLYLRFKTNIPKHSITVSGQTPKCHRRLYTRVTISSGKATGHITDVNNL